jgi:hypothetical protein
LESERTANPVQTTAIFGVRRGLTLRYGWTDHRGKVRAAKEMPNALERFVFRDPAGQDANGMRTAAPTAGVSKNGIA